ncbi:MAG: serine/threonine protein kinase [Planctomycetes bacterium]|nr:serine/threonine protein kinase [Planctomycetota bacterium]
MQPLDPESEALQEIVAGVLSDLEERGDSAIEEACRAHPSRAARIRQSILALRRVGLVEGSSDLEGGAIPERLGEFRLLSRIGGGGMGVVFLARQESLGREVALKIVRPEQLFFPGARERFRREVETIARVQHPGIVPVYSVGEASGIPYFAMERVVGCTLGDALAELASKDPGALTAQELAAAIRARTPAAAQQAEDGALSWVFEGAYTEACLRILHQAASALDHAHRRGVLHRDLKPSNIMITPGGRVMLLDFGLASSSGETSKLTRTGAQLGSLPYMPPEQLAGEHAALDARADVYALGATLYELLALRSPYSSENTETTRRRIQEGKPRALRACNAQVSWDAETVCLTAMERDRERRYASAADFARDLERVLDKRPIAARRASLLLRARRWTQRNPAAAVGLVLGGLLVVGGPLGYALVQREARVRIEEKEARAQKNFDRALLAVQTMLTRLGEHKLEKVPQVQSVRRDVLADALAFYRGFLEEQGSDPRLREETARVQHTLGELAEKLGRPAEASDAWKAEREILETLAREFPEQPRYRRAIARTLAAQADVLESAGKAAQADALRLDVLAALDALGEKLDADGRSLRAELLSLRGASLRTQGKLDEAAEAFVRSIAIYAGLRDAVKDVNENDRKEAWAWSTLASVHRDQRKAAEALEDHRKAYELRTRIVAADPANTSFREGLGQSQITYGWLLMSQDRMDEGRPIVRSAVETWRQLAKENPDVPLYWQGHIVAATNLSSLLTQEQQLDEAREYADLAVDAARALRGRYPDVPVYASTLAETLDASADVVRAQGRFAEARTRQEESLALFRSLAKGNAGDATLLDQIADAQVGLAEALLGLGQHASAADALRELPPVTSLREDKTHWLAIRALAGCIGAAAADEKLADAEREAAASAYAKLAVETIASLRKLDTEIWEMFERSQKAAPLRARPEYVEFREQRMK